MTDLSDLIPSTAKHYVYDRQFRGKWRRCTGWGRTITQADDDVIEKFGFSRVIRRADTLEVIWDRNLKNPRVPPVAPATEVSR